MDLLIVSLYNLSHKQHSDIYDAAVKFYGTRELVPETYFVYFFGKGIDAKIEFEVKGENWVEVGAKGMWQYQGALNKQNITGCLCKSGNFFFHCSIL